MINSAAKDFFKDHRNINKIAKKRDLDVSRQYLCILWSPGNVSYVPVLLSSGDLNANLQEICWNVKNKFCTFTFSFCNCPSLKVNWQVQTINCSDWYWYLIRSLMWYYWHVLCTKWASVKKKKRYTLYLVIWKTSLE